MYVTFSVNVGGDVISSTQQNILEENEEDFQEDFQEEEEEDTSRVSSSSSPLTGVRLRLSQSNQCGARIVQVQSSK